MAYCQIAGDLFGAPMQAEQGIGPFFHPRRYGAGALAVRGAFNCQRTGMLWTVSASAALRRNLRLIVDLWSLIGLAICVML